jgi:hypothetical protein
MELIKNTGVGIVVLAAFVALTLGVGIIDATAADMKNTAVVTRLEGRAMLVNEANQVLRHLKQGDRLKRQDTVSVAADSRIELRLPDDSYVRFNAGTRFELKKLVADKRGRKRDINVNVMFGKVWATVSKLLSNNEHFQISTKTAVAGVRGTVYRLNVNEDNSAIVKVYDGAVNVASASSSGDPKGRGSRASASGPGTVSGPHPVAGPHPVSMEEWVYIVRAMQQINIQADGTPQKPFRFSYEADASDDWVQWNRERDAAIQNAAPDQPGEAPGVTPDTTPDTTEDAQPEQKPENAPEPTPDEAADTQPADN